MHFMRLSCVVSMVMCCGLQGAAGIPNNKKLGWLMTAISADNNDFAFKVINDDFKNVKKKAFGKLLDIAMPVPGYSKGQMTPLHYAAKKMMYPVVERLLERGAQVNSTQSMRGFTPAMVVALLYEDHPREEVDVMMELLIRYGADCETKYAGDLLSVDKIVQLVLGDMPDQEDASSYSYGTESDDEGGSDYVLFRQEKCGDACEDAEYAKSITDIFQGYPQGKYTPGVLSRKLLINV